MAYKLVDGSGPFPNKAGEFCGNHKITSCKTCQGKKERAYLARMRFGRPRPCRAGTAEEMRARGYIGLYLKDTHPLQPEEIEVETPEDLKEPE